MQTDFAPQETHPSLQDSVCFAEICYQHFLDAVVSSTPIIKYYRIANFTFCLWFAGQALVDLLTPALEHLTTFPVSPCDMTICIWDSYSTGTEMIELPSAKDAYSRRGEIIGYNNQRIQAVMDEHTRALNIFDKQRNLGLYWVKDVNDLPWWIGGSPLQLILHWWLREEGFQLTHAGAVGYTNGGVLLAGKGGSGKSTTSLACIKAGMNYVSEDYCLLSDAPQPQAYCVYNSAKIEPKTLTFFPEIRACIDNINRNEHEKAFVYQYQHYPQAIIASLPLQAILVLKIENSSNSWLESISSETALPALAVTTVWQLINTGTRTINHLKRVTESLPCYHLHLGSDLTQIPKLIHGLI